VITHQVSLQLHGKTKGLPHHNARHGTIEMVDASDEDGSSLSFNSGGSEGLDDVSGEWPPAHAIRVAYT
jgi:hypothetical protein